MSSAALPLEPEVWRPKFNPWLIAVVVALAAFMEVLDTSIANVALPYMAGNLGASNDQSTRKVLTSLSRLQRHPILPISGWFANTFGRKRFFMSCLAIFTVSSLLCGFAPSLGLLLLFRVFQRRGRARTSSPWLKLNLADTFPPHQLRLGVCPVRHLPPLQRSPSVPTLGDGSPPTIPGAGFFSLTSRLGL